MAPRRPKDIGTAGETAVLHVLQHYWPHARRNVLFGSNDQGDIGGCGPFVFEVKAGHQAWESQPGHVAEWLEETRREAVHAGRAFGILVVARKGFSALRAKHWWAWMPLADFSRILGSPYDPAAGATAMPIRLELADMLQVLGDQGHVDPDAR